MLRMACLLDCACFVYIDDWLPMAPSREALVANMAAFEGAMARVGFGYIQRNEQAPRRV